MREWIEANPRERAQDCLVFAVAATISAFAGGLDSMPVIATVSALIAVALLLGCGWIWAGERGVVVFAGLLLVLAAIAGIALAVAPDDLFADDPAAQITGFAVVALLFGAASRAFARVDAELALDAISAADPERLDAAANRAFVWLLGALAAFGIGIVIDGPISPEFRLVGVVCAGVLGAVGGVALHRWALSSARAALGRPGPDRPASG